MTAPSPSPVLLQDRLAYALAEPLRRSLGRDWTIDSVAELAGGHAGCMFQLAAVNAEGVRRRLAIKCAPSGVAQSGAADIARQVPLLSALAEAGVRVPRIVWHEERNTAVGVAYVAFEWVSGAQNFPLALNADPLPDFVWKDAVAALAALAEVDYRKSLVDWMQPRTLAEEIEHWRPTYMKSPDTALIERADRARQALLANLPNAGPLGVTHGDYQTSNFMIEGGRIHAIIDWDLAALGDTLTDLGWLMMWADPRNWRNEWKSRCDVPITALAETYFALRQRPERDMRWHMGLACYKFASITCHSLKLHRSGRRVDDVWERFALDAPHLFDRASELAEQSVG